MKKMKKPYRLRDGMMNYEDHPTNALGDYFAKKNSKEMEGKEHEEMERKGKKKRKPKKKK